MGQALYRTYRSRSFDEVVGQEHITKTLAKAVKIGRISHAYLFTGPKGVGKTSVARLLAYAVNELAYEPEATHLDIIEIDAASNRRIDEVRDIREKVHVAPAAGKYKVYIIDEVHMLTKEAFNALLKTLEEPPAHAIFILATTDAHKLPQTITSRTQRYNFRTIPRPQVVKHLETIAKKENIGIDKSALELLAAYGEGSFRDSISLLDQLASTGSQITAQLVRDQLGLPTAETVNELLDTVRDGDTPRALDLLSGLQQQAIDPGLTARLLADKLRYMASLGAVDTNLLDLLKDLIEVPSSPFANEALEIALLRTASRIATDLGNGPAQKPSPAEPTRRTKTKAAQPPQRPQSSSFDLTMWEAVLSEVRQHSASLYTALRLASPNYHDGQLMLYFQFSLHQRKVDRAAAKVLIAQAIENISGAKVIIKSKVDKQKSSTSHQSAKDFYRNDNDKNGGSISAIHTVFGSAEVVEIG